MNKYIYICCDVVVMRRNFAISSINVWTNLLRNVESFVKIKKEMGKVFKWTQNFEHDTRARARAHIYILGIRFINSSIESLNDVTSFRLTHKISQQIYFANIWLDACFSFFFTCCIFFVLIYFKINLNLNEFCLRIQPNSKAMFGLMECDGMGWSGMEWVYVPLFG